MVRRAGGGRAGTAMGVRYGYFITFAENMGSVTYYLGLLWHLGCGLSIGSSSWFSWFLPLSTSSPSGISSPLPGG